MTEGRGSTRQGRKIREYVLERDRHRCRVKLAGICTVKATVVHHTLGFSVTGDDPDHMVASCWACNQKVGDPRKLDPKPKVRKQW